MLGRPMTFAQRLFALAVVSVLLVPTLPLAGAMIRSQRELGINFYGDVDDLVNDLLNSCYLSGACWPTVTDNPDGTCSVSYSNSNGNHPVATAPCPIPLAQWNSDGSVTVYDDKNNNWQSDSGETILTTDPPPSLWWRDNTDGTCTVYDGADPLATVPCPMPGAQLNSDGSATVYDDKDNDGRWDGGEEIATVPSVDPKMRANGDGTCLVYNDSNHNGASDWNEELATMPCPNPKTRSNADGSTTVYDDKNNNGQVEGAETIATVPGPPPPPGDSDADQISDAAESQLCGRQIVRDQIATLPLAAGRCLSSGDYARLPGETRSLSAARGTAAGQIALSWQPPTFLPGAAPIKNFSIYRGDAAGTETYYKTVGNVLSFIDTGIPNNAVRFYKVSAINAVGEGDRSGEASAAALGAPTAPRSLSAFRGSAPGQISLSWQPPADNGGSPVTGYAVYAATVSGGLYSLAGNTGTGASFVHTGIPNGAIRYYRVTASNAYGESGHSNEASAQAPDVPTVPSGLSTSRGPGIGQISLSWGYPSWDGGLSVVSYKVYKSSTSDGTYVQIGTSATGSFVDGGYSRGSIRYYRVSAVNAAGEGATAGPALGNAPDVPAAPPNLEATPGPGPGEIRLTWGTPDNGGLSIEGYRVYRSDSSGTETPLADTGNVNEFKDAERPSGTTWFYKIAARNVLGLGAQSNEASAAGTMPEAAADGDHDGIPDSQEPAMCAAENQNDPSDGWCTGTDYHPP